MKTFVCAMCLLLLLIGIIITNTAYLTQITDQMLRDTVALPRADTDNCANAVATLEETWERAHTLIGLTVNAHSVEQIERLIGTLKIACREQAVTEFEINRELLLRALHELRHLQRCTVHGIL